jgi:hypothetical protein
VNVYDGAVKILGKDGTRLQAWRVAVYQNGGRLSYMTVTAPNSREAEDRARRRWPNGNVFTL